MIISPHEYNYELLNTKRSVHRGCRDRCTLCTDVLADEFVKPHTSVASATAGIYSSTFNDIRIKRYVCRYKRGGDGGVSSVFTICDCWMSLGGWRLTAALYEEGQNTTCTEYQTWSLHTAHFLPQNVKERTDIKLKQFVPSATIHGVTMLHGGRNLLRRTE